MSSTQTNGHNNGQETAIAVRTSHFLELSSSRDLSFIREQLKLIMAHCNPVPNLTSVPVLREGCAVSFNPVLVDVSCSKCKGVPFPDPADNEKSCTCKREDYSPITAVEQGEIYSVTGKYGLGKPVLMSIAAALNMNWEEHGGRVDDRSNPHIREYTSYGTYHALDGQERQVKGTECIDLSDGSDLWLEVYDDTEKTFLSKAKRDNKYKPLTEAQVATAIKESKDAAMRRIRKMRIKIDRLCETKSQLAAIRNVVKTSYTLKELKKPFMVMRLAFTGESNDPELRRCFAEKTADFMMGGRQALYGGRDRAQLPAAPASAVATATESQQQSRGDQHTDSRTTAEDLKDLQAIDADLDDDTESNEDDRFASAAESDKPKLQPPPENPMIIAFGKWRTHPITDPEIPTGDLGGIADWYVSEIEDETKAKHKKANQADLSAVLNEVGRREHNLQVETPETKKRKA